MATILSIATKVFGVLAKAKAISHVYHLPSYIIMGYRLMKAVKKDIKTITPKVKELRASLKGVESVDIIIELISKLKKK